MRIVLFAYGSLGSRVLRTLVDLRERVALVVTHPDSPGEKIWFDSVARIAAERGIPAHEASAEPPRGPAPYGAVVEAARPDLILSATFRAMIPAQVLRLASRAALNLHPSLLPRYRGRAPINWVLVNGEPETGLTLHHMVKQPDAGDIVAQVRLEIGPDETAPELARRMDEAAVSLVREHLPRIREGTAPRIPQDPSKSSYFGRRRPEDGRFEWSWPAARIHNLVRAVTRPFPGAFTVEPDGARLMVWKTRRLPAWPGPPLGPGELTTSQPETHGEPPRLVAGTGEGALEILDWERVNVS